MKYDVLKLMGTTEKIGLSIKTEYMVISRIRMYWEYQQGNKIGVTEHTLKRVMHFKYLII